MQSDQLDFRLLGRFSVRRGGEEVPQAAFGGRLTRTLLRILLARRGAFVSKDILADALWSQRLPADPDGNLEILVSRARRALGDRSVILTGPRGYAFSRDARSVVDAEAFLAAVEAGRKLMASGRPVEALSAFREALAVWGGEPFAEDAYAECAQELRRELARAHLEALEGAATASLATGQPGQAVGFAERAVTREPLREASQLLLMRALAASGDQAAALGAFESFRALLAHELGLDPSPDARYLHLKILRGELSPPSQPARAPVVTAPVAAAPLPPPEAFPFVGRGDELDLVLSIARPGGPRTVTVEGPSGSGKSRLLAEAAARFPVPAIAARAYLPEREEPWALARTLLREALALDIHAAHTLPDLCARALADTLPELEEVRSASERPVDPESRRSLAFEGAVRILRSIASDGAVILVDDLQWADATSLDLLHLAVRRVGGLGLVAAYRPEQMVAEASVAGFL